MRTNIDCDLKRMRVLAYKRFKWGAPLLRKFHNLPREIKACPDFPLIEKLYSWLLAPISLWPSNMDAVGRHVVRLMRSRKKLTPELHHLLELLPEAPSDAVRDMVVRHEQNAEQGRFEHVVRATHKLAFQEDALQQNPEFAEEWKKTCRLFDIKRFRNGTNLIQRKFVEDVSNREAWTLDWENETHRFFAVFNIFCHRWNLHGMDGDMPILLRAAVNVTAQGTALFVPTYWSFDPRRDIEWSGFSSLHRVRRGSSRQGPKLGMNQIERRTEARVAKRLLAEAKAKGIRGMERDYWVMGQLGWDVRTQPNRLWRLMKWAKNQNL